MVIGGDIGAVCWGFGKLMEKVFFDLVATIDHLMANDAAKYVIQKECIS